MKRVIISLLLFTTISFADTPNLIINEFLASNASTNLDPDFFSFCDWIEIYNSEDTVVQIGGYYITDDLSEPLKFQFPESCTIEPYSFLTIWADGKDLYPGSLHPTPLNRGNINIIGYHANFKLKKSGEEIGLFTPTGDLIHSKIFEQQITDISYGNHPNDNTQWVYYFEPSPNDSNMIIGYEDTIRSAPPQFLSDGGFYAASQAIELTSYNESAMIRFTLDGSKPNITSEVYNGPIIIDSTTVIRAQVFEDSILPSPIKTETYFINEEFTLPVISMATDPVYLWNEEIGIHVAGINGNYGCDGTYSNYNQDWERPISFEYYNIDEDLGFKFNAGIKIFGGCSRGHAQKSLAIYAKNKYDTDIINYQLFNDKLINQFKSFILRNSGSDWSHSEYYPGTMLRDGMMQSLVINQMDIDYQAYQPAIIFLNGMYWGILNIREKLNGDYLESNHDVDADNVDIIKRNITVYAGDAEHFYSLLSFIESDGTTLNENYQYIKTQMEVNEYINYQISEIYFGNYDWPHNNVKYWRPKTETGKWRWILTDTDAGFSLSSFHGFSHNFLVDVSTWNGSVDCILAQNCGENDDMEIYLFKKLLENSEFQNDFINRFAFYLNTTFQPNRVINIINSLSINIEQEMQRHLAKWGDVVTITDWENNVEILREFAFERSSYVRQHIIDYFELNGTSELIIDISDLNAGRIEVHNLNILTFPDTGIYFQDIPIRIMAIPNEGYQFVNWQGNSGEISNSDTISLIISGDSTITAVFEPTVSNVDEVFIPTEYSLHQNYPNPFNPITTLRYDLPENGHVNITIYDMLGRVVKSLINQSQDAGFRSVIWNATNDYGKPVSAGIYLYQIQAGEYISTKKMVLLK